MNAEAETNCTQLISKDANTWHLSLRKTWKHPGTLSKCVMFPSCSISVKIAVWILSSASHQMDITLVEHSTSISKRCCKGRFWQNWHDSTKCWQAMPNCKQLFLRPKTSWAWFCCHCWPTPTGSAAKRIAMVTMVTICGQLSFTDSQPCRTCWRTGSSWELHNQTWTN